MLHQSLRLLFLFMSVTVILLSGCNETEKEVVHHYYMPLDGESEHWVLSDFEVVMTPEALKVGNGKLMMKQVEEYESSSMSFDTHLVVNGEDSIVHSGAVSGNGIDIAEESTGAIEGGPELTDEGDPIRLKDVSRIYMTVKWRDTDKKETMEERIDLYDQGLKEDSFLDEEGY
ncbi:MULTISPECIES: hypothetical protein [Pontibacillus]|uniref:Uncharacterized protein n=1 Tax=Pontibacillus chungwhensis TaxID=265426 RepID=A0ABY8V0I5_9BACI|nr:MULTISPECIES: hypothetical protein [Pontibacillus]MCD5322157.1 hypothetical protein [Pontibacillus sp. HN14]WIF99452.1 hypothetical protein QNI29_07285 [Pontibacillus chungwhensis]